MTGQVVDLSYGGVCVAKPTALPRTAAELEIVLDEAFAFKARVVYVRREQNYPKSHDHFGLEFLETWAEKIEKLNPLLRKYVDSSE